MPLEQTTNIFNTHIHGNQNVVAAGTNISQDVRQVVRSNDLGSLLSYLKSVGVSEEDAQELKKAIEEDGPAEESAGLGPRVRDWLGKKAAGRCSQRHLVRYSNDNCESRGAILWLADITMTAPLHLSHTPPLQMLERGPGGEARPHTLRLRGA